MLPRIVAVAEPTLDAIEALQLATFVVIAAEVEA